MPFHFWTRIHTDVGWKPAASSQWHRTSGAITIRVIWFISTWMAPSWKLWWNLWAAPFSLLLLLDWWRCCKSDPITTPKSRSFAIGWVFCLNSLSRWLFSNGTPTKIPASNSSGSIPPIAFAPFTPSTLRTLPRWTSHSWHCININYFITTTNAAILDWIYGFLDGFIRNETNELIQLNWFVGRFPGLEPQRAASSGNMDGYSLLRREETAIKRVPHCAFAWWSPRLSVRWASIPEEMGTAPGNGRR